MVKINVNSLWRVEDTPDKLRSISRGRAWCNSTKENRMLTLTDVRNGLRDELVAEVRRSSTPPYTVSDAVVPLDDVVRHYNETRSLIVWSGGSDKAIFDKESNWLFRAWHDWAHIRSMIGFTPRQECDAALFQMREVQSSAFARLVWIEVAEQALHLERTGQFVDDQIAFFLRRGVVSP